MTDVLIVLGFVAMYFLLLGMVRMCEYLLGDKKRADPNGPAKQKRGRS